MGPAARAAPLAAAAADIVRDLVATALDTGGTVTWEAEIAAGVRDGLPVIGFGDVGPSLYDGTAGIGLALAAASTALDVPAPDGPAAGSVAQTARGAVRHALSASTALLERDQLGLFDGAAGIAVSAVSVGALIGDPDVADEGSRLAAAVAERLGRTVAGGASAREHDVIAGTSGVVLALIGLAATLGDPSLLAPVHTAALAIAAAAEAQAWGSAWRSGAAGDDGPPLLGMGHGAAGITLALAEAAAITGDGRLRAACREGLEYERGWYDAERVGWPDLRGAAASGEPAGWMTAWCHGALGIGIGRVRIARVAGDEFAMAEAAAALQAARNLVVGAGTLVREGRPTDCTACHGLAGALELALVAGRGMGVPDHLRAAQRIAALMVEARTMAGRWPCGLPGAGQVPGLMTGTAGVAVALLRAAGLIALPSPLLPGPSGW
jgi:lantibiotic modifying enzyme